MQKHFKMLLFQDQQKVFSKSANEMTGFPVIC